MSQQPAKIKPLAIMLCDDIRNEATGKDILIGVGTGAILFFGSPETRRYRIYFLIEVEQAGLANFQLEVSGDPLLNSMSFTVENYPLGATQKHEYSHAASPPFDLTIVRAGNLVFRWRPIGGKWKTLRIIRIKEKPPQSPPAA